MVYKNFVARCVVSRWDALEVYHRATAQAAASFLDTLLERMPFAIRAIQVDGGSECEAEGEGSSSLFCHRACPSRTGMCSGLTAPTGGSSTRNGLRDKEKGSKRTGYFWTGTTS